MGSTQRCVSRVVSKAMQSTSVQPQSALVRGKYVPEKGQ
jgi:hypothetical protein